ncbi:MAG: NADH-quinone oxidoreductase subunit L [Trueperaceae bacterium]|nr:NADH-quinone oxidoreductase subunit L [Trueperaceae bacterium]
MSPLSYAWLIPLLPALGFGVNILFGYRLGKRGGAYLSIGLLLVSTLLATALLVQVYQAAPQWDAHGVVEVTEFESNVVAPLEEEVAGALAIGASAGRVEAARNDLNAALDELHALEDAALVRAADPRFPFSAEIDWLNIEGEAGLPFGFVLDPLAALMVFMVAFVSLLIHLFSLEYMAGEDRYPTFFAYISLFAAAMLAMVMSRNLFHVLLFWELMGVMSYLLIGFFYKKTAAQQAMKKAFLVTKIADLGLMLGIFWIYREFGTLDLLALETLAPTVLSASVATSIGLLLFVGAVGKSAQFPLHVWLLDAMEGPTPVSAMIHAATMVAAGVYLVARTYPVFEAGNALLTVAWIGGFTALFAAILAPAFADIKKILAWSTVSQLGLMFLGLGAFGWTAALFHLITHAFFKALLFLCSGAMIHGSGTQDIFEMDQLKKYMPTTRWTFIIGGLSLAGVVPFAGFWSKDEVMLAVKAAVSTQWSYALLIVIGYGASLLTAFYVARAYLIAFEQPRQDSPWKTAAWNEGGFGELNMSAAEVEADRARESHHLHDPPHEVGYPMGTALWLLAGGAVTLGLVGSPLTDFALQRFVYLGAIPHLEPISAQWLGWVIGTAVAFAGIGLAYRLYREDAASERAPWPLVQLLQKRFYIDHLYYLVFAKPLTWLTRPVAWMDRRLLDGLVDAFAWLVRVLGDVLRRAQTGRLEHYIWTLAATALVLVVALSYGGLS